MSVQSQDNHRVSFAEAKQSVAGHSFGQIEAPVRRQSSNGMSNSVTRKVVHYENPRKYINFDYKSSQNQYSSQQIGYSADAQQSASSLSKSNAQYSTQQQGFMQTVSQNPAYRFRVTNELDIKYQLEKESMQEEMLQKIERLEQIHYEEVSRLQSEFTSERTTWTQQLEESKIAQQAADRLVAAQGQADERTREELVLTKEKLTALAVSNSTLEQDVQRLQITITEKNTLIEKLSGYQIQYNDIVAQKETLQVQYDDLQKTINESHLENKLIVLELEQKTTYLERDLGDARSELIALKQRIADFETQQTELAILKENNENLKKKVEKAKVTKSTLVSLREQINGLEIHVKEQSVLLVQKSEELTRVQQSHVVVKEESDDENEIKLLKQQNEYLINELGRVSEEMESLQRNGPVVVEKPVYLETVQNKTTIKEVPAKIEERIVYMQDTEQAVKLQKIIAELQSALNIVNQEKARQIQILTEEKSQLLVKLTHLAEIQSTEQPSVLREVVVETVVDRAEVNAKEEEIRSLNSVLGRERVKIAELQEEVARLQKELIKCQPNFKLVKLPPSYRLESQQVEYQLSHDSNVISSSNAYRSSAQIYSTNVVRQGFDEISSGSISNYSRLNGFETINRRVVLVPTANQTEQISRVQNENVIETKTAVEQVE